MKNLIYSAERVNRTIVRMAYEIFEHNLQEQKIVLAGIQEQGFVLAERLKLEIAKISELEITLLSIQIDKNDPLRHDVALDTDIIKPLAGQPLLLIDDVLNSGRTLAYCLKSLLPYGFSKVEIAVLVNRNHQKFPISAKYIGYDLSTTLTEHVEVQLTETASVFLY